MKINALQSLDCEEIISLGNDDGDAKIINTTSFLPNGKPITSFYYEVTTNDGRVYFLPGDQFIAKWQSDTKEEY